MAHHRRVQRVLITGVCRGCSHHRRVQRALSSQARAEGAQRRRVQRVALFRLQALRLSTCIFTQLLRKWMSSSLFPHILAFEGDGTFLMLVVSHIFLTFFVTCRLFLISHFSLSGISPLVFIFSLLIQTFSSVALTEL